VLPGPEDLKTLEQIFKELDGRSRRMNSAANSLRENCQPSGAIFRRKLKRKIAMYTPSATPQKSPTKLWSSWISGPLRITIVQFTTSGAFNERDLLRVNMTRITGRVTNKSNIGGTNTAATEAAEPTIGIAVMLSQ
jgi:hypothetical protein